jgi:hypothetical protein
MEAQVGGDVLVLAALVGQQDDLEAVTELAVLGGAELRLQFLGLSLGQSDADHACLLPLDVLSPPPIIGTGQRHRVRV